MWLLIKTAWRNLFRQRRRTVITLSAMALSLWLAIPTWGLTEGLTRQMLRGITGMELGYVQVHDPAYPKGKALQAALDHPEQLLATLRATPGVRAAAPRVRGYALGSHDESLAVRLVGLPPGHAQLAATAVRFGRAVNPKAPWHADRARACEAVVPPSTARAHGLTVGTMLTPQPAGRGGRCERIQVVGVTRGELGRTQAGHGSEPGKATLILPAPDVRAAFGRTVHASRAVIRHSAPLQVTGVDPVAERRVTFMADKVRQGRYLSPTPAREIVVGYRLAKTMHLRIGDRVFVQAAALDATQGTFYQDFRVVGIYRTGVDLVDRIQVFVHIRDAQRLMTLGNRVHEIAITGGDPRETTPLVRRIQQRLATRLRVVTAASGTREGSRPLPAPVTVFEPSNGGATLLTPYDLQRRFTDLPGVAEVARRVYGQTVVAPARPVRVSITPSSAKALRAAGAPASPDRCTLYLPPESFARFAREAGSPSDKDSGLVFASAETAESAGCATVRIARLSALPAGPAPPPRPQTHAPRAGSATHPETPRPPGLPDSALPAFSLAVPQDGDEDELAELPAGTHTLLRALPPRRVRFVGVEVAREPRLSGLSRRVAKGHYFSPRAAAAEGVWPLLLAPATATQLGVGPGARLLVRVRPQTGPRRWQPARVVGVLDERWAAALPEAVLPYYAAQAVDARRLNARAHELLLVPKPKATPEAIARAARARLKPLVRAWQTIAPDMAKLVQTQDAWVGIMLFIIFAIAAMTVMNTMLMAVWERTREFGVLKSIGMRPAQVFGLIVLETGFLALLAAAVGGGGGVLLNQWAVTSGIDLSAWSGGFTYQGTFIDPVWRAAFSAKVVLGPIVMVELVCLLVSLYPAFRAGRLKPVQALRHVG